MVLLYGVLNSGSGLATQYLQNALGRSAEHLDAGRGGQRLLIGARGSLANRAHVELERSGVGMDLDHRHLRSFVIHVLVESDEARLIRLDEVDQAWHAVPLGVNLARLEPVRRDEDERSGHRASSLAAKKLEHLFAILAQLRVSDPGHPQQLGQDRKSVV